MTASTMVGRRRELSAGEAVLQDAANGAGGILVIDGEAGIGKSRLVAELVARARSTGFDVRSGTADELATDHPFGPLVEALGGDGLSDRTGPHAPGGDLGLAVIEAIVATVEELAARRPLVLVVEDLQWADPSTLRAVLTLARAAESHSLALVLTARSHPRPPELAAALESLAAKGAVHVALGPLDPADALALAAQSSSGAGPSQAQVSAAGGNPLLVIELSRAPGPGSTGKVPSDLRATVVARLRGLPPPAVEVLKVASVLGRRFRLDQLAAVTGRRPADLVPLLESALASGVLGEEAGELVFRHDLIRDAVYSGLALPLRQGLHRDAAHVLIDRGFPPLDVAEHLVAGAGPGDSQAIGWLREAAGAAAPRSRPVAVRLLEHALGLAADLPDTLEALAAELAPLLVQVGRAADAATMSHRVLARGPSPTVESALRRGLGEVLWTQGWLEPAVAELEAAGAVPGASAETSAGALALARYLRCFLGEPARGTDGATDGVGDDFSVCADLQARSVAAAAEACVDDAVALAAQAVSIAVRSPNARIGILHPHLTLGFALLDADRFDDAEQALQEGRRRAEELGAVAWLPLYQAVLAMQRLLAGNWDDALADVEAGTALVQDVGTRLYAPFLLGLSAWVAVQRDDLSLARARMDEAVREFLVATTPRWQAAAIGGVAEAGARWPLEWGLWVNGLLVEAQGSDDEAHADLQNAWSVAAPLRYFLGYRLFAPDLVRLAVRCGNRSGASAVADAVDEGARRSGVPGAAAAARRTRGLLDGDADALVDAAAAMARTPRATEAAFVNEEAGVALAAVGRSKEAVEHLERARAFYQAVSAVRGLARVDAALRPLGVRHRRTTAPSARSGWASLTPTELRIARLAADGLSNRQIGDRLFVSPRTVETHLGHAFAKLGVATRAQLAAEVSRRS